MDDLGSQAKVISSRSNNSADSSSSERNRIDSKACSQGQESNKLSLKKKWEEFLSHAEFCEGMRVNHELLKLRMSTLEFWEEYGYWLMHVATTDKGELYAISSVLNFLSYAHNDVALNYYYPDSVTITTEMAVRKWLLDGCASSGSGNNWYYRLRSKLEELHYIRNVEGGEATCGKSANAGRKVVLSICTYLLKHGGTKTDVLRRYAFATSRMFAGRTGSICILFHKYTCLNSNVLVSVIMMCVHST